MPTFNIGDKVIIRDVKSELNNHVGVVKDRTFTVMGMTGLILVETADGSEHFYASELERYNDK